MPTVMLIVAIPLLVDLTLSPPLRRAKDNASGVAVATELARRHGGILEHFDLWVPLTGAREARRRRDARLPARTPPRAREGEHRLS